MTLERTVKKYRELFKSKPAVTTAHTDKGHFYVSPTTKESYHSVTYFTSFIKDPSIGNWRKNRALEQISVVWKPNQHYSQEVINKLIEQAAVAPEGDFQLAGDIGSQTHAWREQFFKAWIEMEAYQIPDAEIDAWPLPKDTAPEVISGCRAIKKFLKETGYIPVACEVPMVDDELKVGGMCDDVGVFPNPEKVAIHAEYNKTVENPDWMLGGYKIKYHPYLGFVDLKTSNQGKKPAYAYQVRGFYQRMLWKTFRVKPKKTYILHTSKENGTYQIIDVTSMKFLEKDCADLVRLSRSWDKVVDTFKPKVITI